MIVLVDIDKTVADAWWRDHIWESGGWDEYHLQSIHDKVIVATRTLVNCLWASKHLIYGLTSRPGKYRDLTCRWLVENNVMMHDVLMRPDDSFIPAPQVKLNLAREKFGPVLKDNIGLLIEDREDVVAAFLAEGVTCIHVRAGPSCSL
jgi:hypothetical protein